MAQGMYNTKEQVATAAKAAASSGASAGNAYYNSYLSMGENLMAGTVMGMLNKSASLSTIARQAVANALKAAKEEGGVKSPARKWRDQLGKNLASGMALGMQDGKQGVIDQAVGLARAALKGTTDEPVSYTHLTLPTILLV